MNRTDRNALVRGLNALAEMLDLVDGIASEQGFDALDRYRHKAEGTYNAVYAAYEGLLALARKEGAQ